MEKKNQPLREGRTKSNVKPIKGAVSLGPPPTPPHKKKKVCGQNMKMIPKKDMENGCWYLGICRNANIGIWGEKEQSFSHMRYKFGWRIDEIEHFEDVKETEGDGFIPVQKIEIPEHEEFVKLRNRVGY